MDNKKSLIHNDIENAKIRVIVMQTWPLHLKWLIFASRTSVSHISLNSIKPWEVAPNEHQIGTERRRGGAVRVTQSRLKKGKTGDGEDCSKDLLTPRAFTIQIHKVTSFVGSHQKVGKAKDGPNTHGRRLVLEDHNEASVQGNSPKSWQLLDPTRIFQSAHRRGSTVWDHGSHASRL